LSNRNEDTGAADQNTVLCGDGAIYRRLNEPELERIEKRFYAAISEIAIAGQFLNDDAIDEAQNCLTTALSNLSQIQEELQAREVKP
jgi:hypothetical protein